MKRLLEWLILVPLAVVIVAFAVANRQLTYINFDPFAATPAQQIAVRLPLFLALIVPLAIGVLIGGIIIWFNQRKHRRDLRQARIEMAQRRPDPERTKT